MRLVLADDSVLFREGLARLLAEADFEIVATVGDADELLRRVAHTNPDAAIVDIRMPPTHTDEGLAAATRIRARHPHVAVIVLSQYVEAAYALRLLETGERSVGYVLKDRVLHVADFAAAVRRVGAGEAVVDAALVAQLVGRPRPIDPLAELTEREREVLALMAQGLTDRGIGERLWVTPKTVETHISHIFDKLRLPSTALDNRRVHAVLTYLRTPDGSAAMPSRRDTSPAV
jgi:DNA-binding NarL/FixJ family response regulator